MKIRHPLPTEWNKLQLLNDEVMKDNSKYDPDIISDWAHTEIGEKYYKELAVNQNQICFVAEENNTLVGYIVAVPKEFDYRRGTYLEIDNMGVLTEYRGKAVGTMLVEEVKKWAKDHDYNKLFVNSYFKNTSAVAFYKNNGFEEIDVSLEMKI